MSKQFTPLPWDVFQSTDIVARGTGDFIASTNNEHNADFIVLACNSYTTIPTDRELSQAYSQGYQDGRRSVDNDSAFNAGLLAAYDELLRVARPESARYVLSLYHDRCRPAVAQPQPATKGE